MILRRAPMSDGALETNTEALSPINSAYAAEMRA